MSEIKDKNKLVIKNSATIELERRKGFVNILLQGNPNLYRAWVERNNKIVIDISGDSSGESGGYDLDTETPDYIEIVKNTTDNKYYINFVGAITGEGSLVSNDITFAKEGNNTRLTIKESKFVSTSKIKSGTPDYLFVNVNQAGNVSIGLNQELLDKLEVLNDITLPGTLKLTINYDKDGTDTSYNSVGFELINADGTTETIQKSDFYEYAVVENLPVIVYLTVKSGNNTETEVLDGNVRYKEDGGIKYYTIYCASSATNGIEIYSFGFNTGFSFLDFASKTITFDEYEIKYVKAEINYDKDNSANNSYTIKRVTDAGETVINLKGFYQLTVEGNTPIKVHLNVTKDSTVNTETIDGIIRYQENGGIKYYTIYCMSPATNGIEIYSFGFNTGFNTLDFTSKIVV